MLLPDPAVTVLSALFFLLGGTVLELCLHRTAAPLVCLSTLGSFPSGLEAVMGGKARLPRRSGVASACVAFRSRGRHTGVVARPVREASAACAPAQGLPKHRASKLVLLSYAR